jgi:cation transport ATPase
VTDEGDDQENQKPREDLRDLRKANNRLLLKIRLIIASIVLLPFVLVGIRLIGKPITPETVSRETMGVLTLVMSVAACAFGEAISSSVRRRDWKRLRRMLLWLAVAAVAFYAATSFLHVYLELSPSSAGLWTLVFLGAVAALTILIPLGRFVQRFRR